MAQHKKSKTTPKHSRHSKPQLAWFWIRQHRLIVVLILLVLATVMSGIVYAFTHRQSAPPQPTPKPTQKPTPTPPKPKYYSPLTGLEAPDEAATQRSATAIMIENSPDARPQSGLQQAEIIYEAIAEGGITRFVALYQQNKPELIGPVRSLRMYYVDWIAPYDASVAHVGGSRQALEEIRNGHYRDIDQFFNSNTYWRASDRYAPHNVYTSFAKLDELNAAKGFTASKPAGIVRGDAPPAGETASHINVTMSGPTYNSTWDYNTDRKTYLRSQAGAPHSDREHGQLDAQVVVVLNMTMNHVMEDGYRENYQTTGSGDATIFANGQAIHATWHKADRKSQLSFTNTDGQPLPLPRGKTWISAVPVNQGGGVSWQ